MTVTTDPAPARAALLPMYLSLYDEVRPELRGQFDPLLEKIQAELTQRGIEVFPTGTCCVAAEFDRAIAEAERQNVDCILTLHLAYSPSLEAVDAVGRTDLPIVILDTTMDAAFGPSVAAERIMYNHGVHGVMDFASMLRRRGQSYEIVAGHCDESRTFDRTAELLRAAAGARAMRGAALLRVGEAFAGMGDFAVDETLLERRFGWRVRQVGLDALDAAIADVSEDEVAAEVELDRQRYACELDAETHARSVRVGLGLRRMLVDGDYGGFSVNFQAFDRVDRPSNTMPFLETSKAMARGVGYAGEGDVLTAGLVGGLARAFGAVTFTEIFCPDWAGGTLFCSHMGEISPTVAGRRPRVIEKPFIFGGGLDTAVLTCAVKPGPAVFVNLAPGPDERFSLIVAPVAVLDEVDLPEPVMRDTIRTWIRPRIEVPAFLEAYSGAGGTHHSALVLGDRTEAVAAFGRMLDLETCVIPPERYTP